mmetsp:Transcript_19721/g.45358  ORF Transcript_19721/g.45358 Transcript_19721/m.45358 type:complete len:155 (+) Transcript_19721:156-620(+)
MHISICMRCYKGLEALQLPCDVNAALALAIFALNSSAVSTFLGAISSSSSLLAASRDPPPLAADAAATLIAIAPPLVEPSRGDSRGETRASRQMLLFGPREPFASPDTLASALCLKESFVPLIPSSWVLPLRCPEGCLGTGTGGRFARASGLSG